MQTYQKTNGFWVWRYDNRYLNESLFNNVGLTQKIKYQKGLPQDHKLTEKDLTDIKGLDIGVAKYELFNDFNQISEDLKLIPNLKFLIINFSLTHYDELETFDVTPLSKVESIKTFIFKADYGPVHLIGVKSLAKNGIKVIINNHISDNEEVTLEDYDEKEYIEYFNRKNAIFKTIK